MDIAQKKYWRSVEELNASPQFIEESSKEFAEEIPVDELLSNDSLNSNRRDFLKVFGFSITAATLAACTKTPVKRAVPFVQQPEEVSASVPTWYATSYNDGYDYASIIVKTREGRPIKIEGNTFSGVSQGGVNARVHASVLGLYDTARLQSPTKSGKITGWETLDSEVKAELAAISAAGGQIRLLTHSIISPTTQRIVAEFKAKFPGTEHISYDAISASGILEANRTTFGMAALPNYNFDKAEVILGIGADFLGNWISPVEYTKDYMKNRKPSKENPVMSRHIQFETLLTVTGSNADTRATYQASKEALVVTNLYNAIANMAGAAPVNTTAYDLAGNAIKAAAKELWAAKGKALVVCGSNDANVQVMVNAINQLLGSYGTTIDMSMPNYTRQGIDGQMASLVADMNAGKIGALISYGVNPAYDYPDAKAFVSGLAKTKLTVAVSMFADETATNFKYVAAANHYLENWGDAMPVKGMYSIQQPAISPLFDTRSFEESLLAWSGNTTSVYDYLKAGWRNISNEADFGAFWRKALHNGVFEAAASGAQPAFSANVGAAAAAIKIESADVELVTYEKLGIGNGAMAGNPWLQELPDPISRACWDNYLAVSLKYAKDNKLSDGDIVKVEANGYSVEVPVLVQPGTFAGTVALAVGYGRTQAGKAGSNIGANAYPFRKNGAVKVTITNTGMKTQLAQTQTHHTIEGRNIVKETTLDRYKENAADGNIRPYVSVKQEDGTFKKVYPGISRDAITLWQKRDYEGHHWAMAVDLNACTGCGACVVSCQVENNVPVVGKDEVIRRREMHWMRIDRYYTFTENSNDTRITKEKEYDLITAGESIEVAFQPVMCQQCDNAPCETVCPVLATTHSDEGLNQMTYNRCVGTRYCANNCPYKVRRFNWFSYVDNDKFATNPAQTDLGKMVLNPDVTVRARGVMEKCTFCVQRIQAAKLEGKRNNRRPLDGEIKTACQQSCPSNAIVFGDLNDPDSEVSKLFANERAYGVIEELNVLPSVNYLTKVRNKKSTVA